MPETAAVTLTGDSSSLVSAYQASSDAADKLASAHDQLGKATESLGNAISATSAKIKVAMIGATISTITWASSGVKALSAFETAMANVATVADATVMPLGRVGDEIRKMATSGIAQTAE